MENQLEIIIKESGLEGAKADYIMQNFEACFALAAEWEAKAKTLVVTSAEQKTEMGLAREGRLILREKRIAIEKSRVKMKEDVLKEGRAIDAVAGKLKDLITPIETYLDTQEHFVEIEQKKKDDSHRAEVERRMAVEEAAKRKEDAERSALLQAENERLRKEGAEREKKAAEALRLQEIKLAAERSKARQAQEKADAEKAALQAKMKAEQDKINKERTDRENAVIAEKAKVAALAKKKLEAERAEKERLEALLKAQVTCPKCNHKFLPKGK